MNQISPRHLSSFPLFGIEAHGFWTVREDAEARLFVLASTSAVLWMLAIVYSGTVLVPINNRLKSNPPPDWKTYRRSWDLRHSWRILLLTTAFMYLFVGIC